MTSTGRRESLELPERELPLWRSLDRAAGSGATISIGATRLPWSELRSQARRLACGLKELGIRPGDRVASISTDRMECVEMLLAVAAIGAIWVPLGPYLKGRFLDHQLRTCEPQIVIADQAGAQACAAYLDAAERPPRLLGLDRQVNADCLQSIYRDGELDAIDDGRTTTAILFTSGTTGPAKGCMVSQGYFVKSGACYSCSLEVADSDIIYSAFPLFHGAGVATAMMALVARVTYVNPGSFSASRFMAEAADANATVVIGTGSMATAVLCQPPRPHDTQHNIRVAEFVPLSRKAQQHFSDRFGLRVYGEHYGQTECMMTTQTPLSKANNPGTAGCASPLVELRVVDDSDQPVTTGTVGEVVVRPRTSAAMFSGYWRQPEETLRTWRGLWHHTGDFGALDAAGILTFVDRKSDSIRRRGENISSLEIEAAMIEHPEIADAAVHAISSSMTEDDIKVCIVPTANANLQPADLFDFFAGVLPYFAIPRYVEIVDELPRTANHKVRKDVLRERANGPTTWDLEELGLVVARRARRSTQ